MNIDPPPSIGPEQKKETGERKDLLPILLEKLNGALDGYCTMLVPTPVTNCGYDDQGGWMDKIGATDVGLQFNFDLVPTEVFLSNTAYSHPGIPTLHVELWPLIDDFLPTTTTTGEGGEGGVSNNDLNDFLRGYLLSMENDNYGIEGKYTYISGPDEIIPSLKKSTKNNEDSSTDGNGDDDDDHCKPTIIIQMEHEIPVMPPCSGTNDTISNDDDPMLLTKQKISLLYFGGKKNGIVILRANNLYRLEELLGKSLHYETIRDSIRLNNDNTMTTKMIPKNDVYDTMASFFARARRHRRSLLQNS